MTQEEMLNKNNFILHDQHCHSYYSRDSKQSLKIMYETAYKLGCKYFVTTEHTDFDVKETGDNWLVDFPSLKKELNELAKEYPVIPLLGVEIGYREEYKKELIDIVNNNDFDTINLSIHGNKLGDYYFIDTFGDNIDESLKQYYEFTIQAVKTFPKYNVLSHIDYGYKTVSRVYPNYDFTNNLELIKEIMKELIKRDKALEINIKVQNTIGIDHTKELLTIYKELGGCKLTLSSDAHVIENYHLDFDKYMQLIKECGFDYIVYFVKQKEYKYYL